MKIINHIRQFSRARNRFFFVAFAVIYVNCFSQQVADFKAKSFVKYRITDDNDKEKKKGVYKNRSGGYLQEIIHDKKSTKKEKYTGTYDGKPLTIEEEKESDVITVKDVIAKYGGRKRLKGDIRQSGDTLYFYPWSFVNPEASIEKKLADAKSMKEANDDFKNKEFVMIIPFRTVVKVRYSAWHLGALTLPAKIYLSSKVQLDNNAAFDINLAGMIGYKWGTNMYYNFPHKEKGESYLKANSINLFVGISKVVLNSKNTINEIAEEQTLAGITIGPAWGFHYNRVGVFIASGFDFPMGNNSQQWIFNGQPWAGVGIGLKLD